MRSELDLKNGIELAETELDVRVLQRSMASSAVLELVLGALDESDLPLWQPGAHVDFLLPNGFVRQYSLCGQPLDAKHWRFGVLKEESGRGGSAYIHDQLKSGDVIKLRGPRNNFYYVRGKPALFIAGGIGITPLLPMVRVAAADKTPWRMVYGGRSLSSMAFVDELARLRGLLTVRPEDEYGLLKLDEIVGHLGHDEQVYCCGPEPLIAAVEDRCKGGGALNQLHVERFKAIADASTSTVFDVILRKSGKKVRVDAKQSILEAVEGAGVHPPFSCREGTCGTCETKIVRGSAYHRDAVLSPDEKMAGKTMMICISRSVGSEIELDL